MKLLYVTAALPYGIGEAFIVAELDELQRQGNELTIVPTRGRGPVVHEDARALEGLVEEPRLLSLPIVCGAAIVAIAAPLRTARAILVIFRSRSVSIFAKNAAVVPKALWLARRLRQLEIDHLHAHWGGTSSTLAMLAAEVSGISWSLTLHRWDIAEDNLLAEKIPATCFVQRSASRTRRGAASFAGSAGQARSASDGRPITAAPGSRACRNRRRSIADGSELRRRQGPSLASGIGSPSATAWRGVSSRSGR
jgi:hypothetical protein